MLVVYIKRSIIHTFSSYTQFTERVKNLRENISVIGGDATKKTLISYRFIINIPIYILNKNRNMLQRTKMACQKIIKHNLFVVVLKITRNVFIQTIK